MTAARRVVPGPRSPISARDTYRLAHDRGRALAELCRLQIARVSCAILIATAVATGAGFRMVLSGAALVCASCAIASALNDRADVVSDRLNQRTDRPLATGVLGDADVMAVLCVASLVIVVSQWGLPQPGGLVVTATGAFAAWASACEPLALQRRGLIGLAVLAFGYFALPIMLVLGPGRITVLVPLVLVGSGVLAHKDVKDGFGDREAGKRTLLVQVGYRRMSHTAFTLGAAGVVGLCVTVGPGWWFVPAAVTVVMLGLMARRGHSLKPWIAAKTALALTAVLVGARLGSIA